MIARKIASAITTEGALLVDRDGIVNFKIENGYVLKWDEFIFIKDFAGAVCPFVSARIPIIILTNQSCIGRGISTAENITEIMDRAVEMLNGAGVQIAGYVICPHAPDQQCDCRKPKPGMLQKAAQMFGLNLECCAMVGDSSTDLEAARDVNCPGFLADISVPDHYRSAFRSAYQELAARMAIV